MNDISAKSLQLEIWQSFIDWCIASGQCKPEQLARKVSSQQEFMNYCRKFFNRQFSATTSSSRSRKRSSARTSRPTSYKFPRTGSTSRRLRRAA